MSIKQMDCYRASNVREKNGVLNRFFFWTTGWPFGVSRGVKTKSLSYFSHQTKFYMEQRFKMTCETVNI